MLNKYFKQDAKQSTTSRQETKLEQERAKLEFELSKAKSQIAQLEDEKMKLSSKTSSLQGQSKERSDESGKYKQLLAESERKLALKDKEAKSLQEQIEVYVREIKSQSEKLSGLRDGEKNQRTIRQEVTVHQHGKDNEAALMKTGSTGMQKTAQLYRCPKCNWEDETLKSKVSSETSTATKTMKESNLKGPDPVKQDKKEVIPGQSLHDSPQKKTLNTSVYQASTATQKDTQTGTKSQEPTSTTAQGYLALCGLTDKQTRTRVIRTTTYEINEVETLDKKAAAGESKTSAIYSTSQKSQDSKTLQSLIKFKLLDREILRKLDKGLITMEEVQASLAQYSGKPTAIAGVYVVSSKKKLSFLEAAEKGFLAKTYALEFLEAQAATGSLTDLSTGQTHSVDEAVEKGMVDKGLKDKLLEVEKAVSGYSHGGKKLSVFQAMEGRILDRFRGKKILEVQIATGGLINPETGVRVPVSIAVDQGLVSEEFLRYLYDSSNNPKGFHNPDTGQKAYYSEILKTCIYDVDGGVLLYPFGEGHQTNNSPTSSHRASVISSSSGVEMSAYEAFKSGRIDKRTYMFLSQHECEWHETSSAEASGNHRHMITDAISGRQLCLESAVSQRYLETSEFDSYRNGILSIYEIADIIFSRMVVVEDVHSPVAGLWDVSMRRRLSILQGFQQGFTDRTTALRLLEAQACTGGICDPTSGDKVSIADALKRGLLDEPLSQQLKQFEQAYNGIVHPKTSKVLPIPKAIQENLLPKDAGFRCIEFQLLTGGFINPDTHDRVSLEEVIQSGLIDKTTATTLKEEKFLNKSLTCPKTKRKITFKEALERSVYDCHTGLRLLEAMKLHGVGSPIYFSLYLGV
ncbi:uncharacterized protein LOC141794724 [Halichoeres trimaculatus]|uniref:uncharacterized protein LOC141794724 n=1 Tax=Halichoeres trimaculatus TaxID=147232 RepID=UPI003D9EF8D4